MFRGRLPQHTVKAFLSDASMTLRRLRRLSSLCPSQCSLDVGLSDSEYSFDVTPIEVPVAAKIVDPDILSREEPLLLLLLWLPQLQLCCESLLQSLRVN